VAYTTLAELKIYLDISTGTTGDDDLLERFLTVAQQEIEDITGTVFESSAATRVYKSDALRDIPVGSQVTNPSLPGGGVGGFSWDWPGSGVRGYRVLKLDRDLLSITTLTNGDTNTISSTGYWLEPRNDPPYRYIRLRTSEQWAFETDGEISILGVWGKSTAPSASIVQANLELAAYLYKAKDSQIFDVTATPELGIITVPKGFPQHVRVILEQRGIITSHTHII